MSRENLQTRDRILDSCWQLLESGGGSAVRMSDIAKNAGISRQAVYLHFPTRAELLTATTHYVDKAKNVDGRLQASRNARNGTDRMEKFILAWGNYIPEIYGIAKALFAMKDSDVEAAAAWNDRMAAVRHGCAAVTTELSKENRLHKDFSETEAVDLLWTLLSVRTWEHLTLDCGWSQEQYLQHITDTAKRALVRKTSRKKG